MSESLSRTPSRFSVLLVITNLSSLLLLIVWLWQYWHGSSTSAADASFFDRMGQLVIFNYSIDYYIFMAVASLVLYPIILIAIKTKNPVVTRNLLVVESIGLLAICISLLLDTAALHMWGAMVNLGFVQSYSSYHLFQQKIKEQNSDKASSLMQTTFVLFCLLWMLDVVVEGSQASLK